MGTISDSLDKDFAQAWRPNPGDKIVGTVIELTEREGTFGKYPIVTVRTAEQDELAVHAFHEVLSTELARVAPAVGDEIGIKYLGKHPERGYHQYRVRRAGGDGGFSWRQYASSDAAADADVPIDKSGLDAATDTGSGEVDNDDDPLPF